jgi:hypothetical protein
LRIVTKYLAAGSFILLSASVLINDAAFSFPSDELNPASARIQQLPDSTSRDTIDLKYPFKEDPLLPYSDEGKISPLFLKNPSNISSDIVYDPESNTYVFSEKEGYRHLGGSFRSRSKRKSKKYTIKRKNKKQTRKNK